MTSPPSSLPGRGPEQRALARLLEQTAAGQGGALVLRGPAGIGKTALLEHIAALAIGTPGDPGEGEQPSWRVLRASGVPAEQALPLATLQWLLQPLTYDPGTLPADQADFLGPLLTGDPGTGITAGPTLHATLNRLGRDRPVLVMVDRVEWIDEASRDALAFAARRAGHDRVAFVFAVRSPTPGRPGTVHGPDGVDELHLDGLDPGDAAGLLADRFPDLAARRRSEIVTAAGGNPLALLELPAGLDPDQQAGLGGPGLPPGLQPIHSPLQDEIAAAVDTMPGPTGELLLLLAAAGGRLDLDVVHRAGEDLAVTLDDTVRLEQMHLGHVEGSRVTLAHPLIGPAVYRAASVTRRARVHRLLSATCDGEEVRSWHLATATLVADPEVAAALAGAAATAFRAGRHLEATAGYERAAALDRESHHRKGWLVAAAEAAVLGGLPARAIRLIAEARATEAPEPAGNVEPVVDGGPIPLDARLALLDAVLADPPHDHRRRHRRLMEAATRPGLDTLETASPLFVAATENAWYLGDGDLAREAAVRIGSHPAATTAHALAALVAGATGPALGALRPAVEARTSAEHDGPWREDLTALVPDPGPTGPAETATTPPALLPPSGAGAGAGAGSGDRTSPDGPDQPPLDDLAAASLGACTAAGAPGAAYQRALQALLEGRFDRAAREADGALLLLSNSGNADPTTCCLLHRTDRPHWLARLGGLLAWLSAVEGAQERCRSLAAGSLELARTPLATPATVVAHWALALLDLGQGRHEEALVRLGELNGGPARHLVTAHHTLPDQIEAAVRAGQPAAAAEALGRLAAFAEQSRQPWLPAVVARCRALAETEADPDKLFAEAVAAHGRADQPYELARTRLAYGEWLRRMSRRRDARPHLQAAADLFGHLGAVPWADRAHNELRAAGYLTRAPAEDKGHAEAEDPLALLTSQERQVVQLAATGATNREIGARLYLSPRTVAYHLYKAFPKLKVTSRHELARLVPGS